MATIEETKKAVAECLSKIGAESGVEFIEFVIEDHTNGKYRAGVWTFKVIGRNASIEYWFSRFSSRREDYTTSYQTDDDPAVLERGLRAAFDTVREAVKRKKGMF